MSTTTTRLAVGGVRWWVRTYTAGLPRAARDARQAELASDLWEQEQDARASGATSAETVAAMLGRCLLGIPADLFWRLDLEEEPQMLTKIVIERSTGLLMLLLVAVIGLGLTVGRFGVGLAAFSMVGLLMVGLAAGLYVTFRPHEPALATVGAFLMLAAGALMLVNMGAGRSLHDLAGEWRAAGGTPGDQVWTSARAVALMFEHQAAASLMLLLGGLLAFGGSILRSGAMPRWLGGLEGLSGLLLVLGLTVGAISELSWGLIMASFLVGLLGLLIAGLWMLLKGTAEARRPGAA